MHSRVLDRLVLVHLCLVDGFTTVTMHAAEEWFCAQFMIATFGHARIVTAFS